ncbi:ketopantoate reductase family protein [Roseobacter sp. GAI101]|uniref:ketopantoate reductase family protein n=1 Tax=Roseobacter sp. (strain GAI101) TaxID=391589 RepID=UPI0001871566|nr:2-dehydropantoate 2-reductase [Roseobacter sp. GAI101]EEB82875.1 2-dehydropantoate 2-reductase [Roseobacter sp. GAI101]
MSEDAILIWGAGAIGGILGAYFARAGHPVHMVDIVEDHVTAMRDGGLRIEGPVEEFTQVLPADTPDTLSGKFRRVILAVKAHHTDAALTMLLPHLAEDGYVVSAQNGLNERLISAKIGADRTLGCFVNFGADWLEPGRILYGNRAAVALGELDGTDSTRLREMHALFSLVEPNAVATDNIWGYLWGKMGYGSLLFGTALTPASMSDAMDPAATRPVFAKLGAEVMQLAAAEGVSPLGFNGFDPDAFLAGDAVGIAAAIDAMVAHNRKTAKTHSGIYRDLAIRKRKTEVDPQIGLLVEIGRSHGIATPALAMLCDLIHDIEDGKREQSTDLLDLMVPVCS